MKLFKLLKDLLQPSSEREENKPGPKEDQKASTTKAASKKMNKDRGNRYKEKNIKSQEVVDNKDGEQDEMIELAEKAYNARVNGDLDKALSLWGEFSSEYPENKHQAMARKARIYIVRHDEKAAQKELLAFFEWYSQKESFNYNSKYFTILISALQDLGYIVDEWPDEDDYIANLSGENVSLHKDLTVKRIKAALLYLRQEEIWSSALEEVENNLDMLY